MMMDKFRRISLSWLAEKRLTEQEKGQEDIVNALCKYYASVSGLGHQKTTKKNVKIGPVWTC
jgi:hypothetical protein